MSKVGIDRKLILIGLILAVLLIASFSVFKVVAQDQNKDDIADRLKQQGVPVIGVTTLNRLPYEIEILLQSASQDNTLTVDDNWNTLLTRREATLAYRWGARLKSYKLVVYNAKGEVISSDQTFLYPEDISQKATPLATTLDLQATRDLVEKQLQLGGLTLNRLEVFDGGVDATRGRILLIEVSSGDFSSANQSLPEFLNSYFWILENMNAEYGTDLVVSHLRVKDRTGIILLDYVKDLEGGTSQWKMVEGLYNDWFPHPNTRLLGTPTPSSGSGPADGYPPQATPTKAAYP